MYQHLTLQKNTSTSKGFSLVEMLISIAIMALLTVMVTGSIIYLYRTNATNISQAVSLNAANKALRSMVGEVRGVMYAEDGSYPLVTIATSTLTFYADVDQDGRAERVRYFVSGTTLKRGVIEPTASSSYPAGSEVVATTTVGLHNVAKGVPLFRYFGADGVEITGQSDMLKVRLVRIEVLVNTDTKSLIQAIDIHSEAALRNLKYNG